jgi:hypothetical protein
MRTYKISIVTKEFYVDAHDESEAIALAQTYEDGEECPMHKKINDDFWDCNCVEYQDVYEKDTVLWI